MRTVARTMLWTLLVALCLMARPAVGQQSGAARSAGDSGVQVDKNSVGGEDLSCQLLDVVDSSSLEGSTPRELCQPGAVARRIAGRVQSVPSTWNDSHTALHRS